MTSGAVLILDDDESVLDALGTRLRLAGFAVQIFCRPQELLDFAGIGQARCLLLDMRMPELDGLTLLPMVTERAPTLPVVIMTANGDVPKAVTAMKRGAFDFLEKPFSDNQLFDVIAQASGECDRRRRVLEPAQAARDAYESLTRREREVLDCMIEGLPNKIIAYNLGCSQRTVEVHRSRVMRKMQAASLPELVRRAEQARG